MFPINWLNRSAAMLSLVAAACIVAPALQAQQAYQGVPSGRVTTKVVLDAVMPAGTPAAQRPVSHTITVDYGQPHARGRVIAGALIPYGEVWRLGANEATTLTTSVDLDIGGVAVPKGTYSLHALATATSMQLIVSKKIGANANVYDAAQDLARIPMRVHARTDGVESLQIALAPTGADAPLGGTLRVLWGTVDATVAYVAKP
jgi:hypothetical protein